MHAIRQAKAEGAIGATARRAVMEHSCQLVKGTSREEREPTGKTVP